MNRPNNINDILAKLNKVKKTSTGWTADCPCAGHKTPKEHLGIMDKGSKAVLTCFNTHSEEEIANALGYESAYYNNDTNRQITQKHEVAHYDYKDADGNLVYQVVRYEPKTFNQRKPDGKDGWIYKLDGVTTVLYHLPEILQAKAQGATIFICEGEKDVETLWNNSLIATCNPMGAGKWKPQYTEALTGAKQIVIIPDKDDAGRQHGRMILQALIGKVASIKVLELPGDSVKDSTDWFNNGGSQLDLLELVDKIPTYKQIIKITEEGGNNLMERHFDPIKWIIPNIIPEGTAILAGTPKAGKSRMSLNIALAVATGGKALGKMEVKQGSVLYVSLEDSARRLHEHLVDIYGDSHPDLSKITFRYEIRLINEGGIEDIENWLKTHPDARLVVIDTLKRIRPKETNGTLYVQDYDAIAPLTDLSARYNIAILVIHHTNKRPKPDDPMDLISGTTGLTGAVDTTIILRRKRGETNATMNIIGRDIEDTEIALDFTGGSWKWLGNAKQVIMGEERKEIVELLKSTPDLTPKQIADSLNKKSGNIRFLLTKMVKDGQVSDIDGVYNATE